MSTEEKWPDFLEVMGALGEKLDRIIASATEKTLPDNVQGIAISDTASTVQLHEGYRYNYLVIGTDAGKAMGPVGTLTIATPAISYAVPVSQGINVLNVKGSTAKLSIAGLTGSYACQFVETNSIENGFQMMEMPAGAQSWMNGVFDVPTTAAQVGSAAGSVVTLLAGSSNADTVFIGNSGSNATFPLYPGQSVEMRISNLNLVWAVAIATGNTLYWVVN